MATTYSLTATGYDSNPVTTIKTIDIPDANIAGNASATPGGMQGTMAKGNYVLAKGPDGAQHIYKFDAERSTAANPVLTFVGP
jgi:hypothetical protein